MNPDVGAAVERFAAAGTLSAEQARSFGRVARRELVSVHGELRLLLYAGVLTTMAGVGLLVKENLDRIGPLAIAIVLGLGALACLIWVARRAAPFTWGEDRASHPALDYILLLGVLLLGADLAYLETQFTPLGAAWPWHLLLMTLVMGALAVRYDSRVVFSLALSTFAAWRGVSTAFVRESVWSTRGDRRQRAGVDRARCAPGARLLAHGAEAIGPLGVLRHSVSVICRRAAMRPKSMAMDVKKNQ